MAYKIVAQKDDITVRSERNSLLIAAAKARIWTQDGTPPPPTPTARSWIAPSSTTSLPHDGGLFQRVRCRPSCNLTVVGTVR